MRLIGAACAVFLLLCCRSAPAGETPARLVSLAPSLTEMVFDLGAGARLAGVTEQCRFPPETAGIPKIGSYQFPNYEAVLAVGPDLVLALEEHAPAFPLLDSLGVAYAVFDHRTLPGILDSLTRLGTILGRAETGARLRDELEAAFRPPEGYAPENAPSLLFVIGRDRGAGRIANATVIGRDNLYDRLVAAAGYRNAYGGSLAYPLLSAEGVLLLDPEHIVEALPDGAAGDSRSDWERLGALRAVRLGNVRFVGADDALVPGMRMARLRRELEKSP